MRLLLAAALALCAAPALAADPPKVRGYVSEERVRELEARVAELERLLAAKPAPALPALPAPATAPAVLTIGGVPHTLRDGVYWPAPAYAAPAFGGCVNGRCPIR